MPTPNSVPNNSAADPHRWVVFGAFAAVYFFVLFHRVSTSVVAPDLIVSFQTSATALGLMSSMYFYAYALEQPLVGYLADRLGPRKVVGFWSLVAALGCILFGLAPSITWAAIGRGLIGFGVGIPLITFGARQNVAHGWAFEYSFFLGSQFNYWGSLFMAAAYVGCIMLAAQALRGRPLLSPLAAAGRMAFTNYIMQTIICTFIFYGYGLGLFGSVARTSQALLVLGIWIFQLIVSSLWLKYFQFGPLEWLWRSLTYWRRPTMRIPSSAS